MKTQQELNTYEIGIKAYCWAYPLVMTCATAAVITRAKAPQANGHAPFNQIGHTNKLLTPDDKSVVSPNSDTLYSSAFLDLKQGAMLIEVPAIKDRYYALTLSDAYTNVIDYIGTRTTGSDAGQYLICGPDWQDDGSNEYQRIRMPTSTCWLIGRYLVESEQDAVNVADILSQIKLSLISNSHKSPSIAERWDLKPAFNVPVAMVNNLSWQEFFRWAGQLLKDNPPPECDHELVNTFSAIGLTESGFQLESLSASQQHGLARAYVDAKALVETHAQNSGAKIINCWSYNLNQGKWGQDYNLRAATALRSLGQNEAKEALYLNARKDNSGQTLNGRTGYQMTFSAGQLPPVDGFWSVTMYNDDNFLVENSILRYAIGDRTKGLVYQSDGSLTLHIQHHQPHQSNHQANWLPAPVGDFRLSLRLYIPHQTVLDGHWHPPVVVANN